MSRFLRLFAYVSVLLSLSTFALGQSSAADVPLMSVLSSTQRKNCVPGFSENPTQFDICRKVPCVIVLEDKPTISITNRRAISSTPFRCNRRKENNSWLGGFGMEVIGILSEGAGQPLHDAYCLFGGDDCDFNHMVTFVGAAKEHLFIFGGSVWLLPERITEDTRTTPPLTEDLLVVVGKRNQKSDFIQAYEKILRPFEVSTWIVFFGYLFLALCFHVLLAVIFAKPRDHINICRHILLDFTKSKKRKGNPRGNSELIEMLNKVAVGTLLFAVTASSVIGVLFYEIAVVNFLFQRDVEPLEKELNNLPLKDLEQFVMVQNDGTEVMLRALVGEEKSKHIKKSQLCSKPIECFNKIEDGKDPAKFFLTYKNALHQAQKDRKNGCDLVAFPPQSPLSSVPSGWYYGSRIPRTRQIALDKAILDSRLKHKIQNEINEGVPNAKCSSASDKIKPPFIGWILLTVIVLCMVPIVFAVIGTVVLRSRNP